MRSTRLAAPAALLAAGALAVRRAERRWETAADPTGGRPLELPAGTERSVTSSDGARLAVWEMGDASRSPIVLVHGWTADRRVWAAVARRLVTCGHRVVCFDLRGHGHSEVGPAGCRVAALADDVRAVLDALDARRAVLAGHSMGGMASQAFAVTHPCTLAERVAHMVLVATAARSPLPGRPGGAYQRAAVALAASRPAAAATASARLGPWVVRPALGARPSIVALRATQESAVAAPPASRTAFLADMGRLDLTADLPDVRVPTTVVWGTRDGLTFPAANREVAGLIPGARSVVLPGAGHQLVFETPDRLAEVLADAADGHHRH